MSRGSPRGPCPSPHKGTGRRASPSSRFLERSGISIATANKKRYEYKITLGKDINGNLLRKSFYSTKSRGDAKRKAEKFKAKYELELLCGGEETHPRVLFSTWAPKCLELYKKPFVKANTYSGTYYAPVQRHLIPYFGRMALNAIMPLHVQQYINEASKKYSPETVKKDFTVLAYIMQTAVDNGLCKSNPASRSIRLPKYETVTTKRSYTQEEYDTVYNFAKKHVNGLSIMLMMETGITRSELLGLRWEDLDTEHGVLTINQGLVAYKSLDDQEWVLESNGLKNKYRQRAIPLVDQDLLTRLSEKPRTIRIASRCSPDKGKLVTTEYIFHSPEGLPYQPHNWGHRVFDAFMRDLIEAHPDIPKLTPHELRHTRATLWLAQGVSPHMAAKLLGHCGTQMLARVYDHTTVDTLRKAITGEKT